MGIAYFDRHPLTFGPSPIHPLRRLSAHLGGAQVWAKREDVSSGLAFGGNKTRKLEYIVPDVLASGADTLVSIGGYQSNHTRQVAAVAAHLGLQALLVQETWVDWPDPLNDRVGNIQLSRIMGADVRLDPHGFDIGIRSSWEEMPGCASTQRLSRSEFMEAALTSVTHTAEEVRGPGSKMDSSPNMSEGPMMVSRFSRPSAECRASFTLPSMMM